MSGNQKCGKPIHYLEKTNRYTGEDTVVTKRNRKTGQNVLRGVTLGRNEIYPKVVNLNPGVEIELVTGSEKTRG